MGEGSILGEGRGFSGALGEGDGKDDGSGLGDGSAFVVAAAGIFDLWALLTKKRMPETIKAKRITAATTNLPL